MDQYFIHSAAAIEYSHLLFDPAEEAKRRKVETKLENILYSARFLIKGKGESEGKEL